MKPEDIKWCPQHGWLEPCNKCNGFTLEEWEEFGRSLLEAVKPLVKGEIDG